MKVGTDGILLGSWATAEAPGRILDIGSGTGLVALLLAQRFPGAVIDAVEADPSASQQTHENFLASRWSDRLNAHCARIQDFSDQKSGIQSYSLIACNPPWFRDSLKSKEHRRSMARHADSLSSRDLTSAVRQLLTDDGRFSTILAAREADDFLRTASDADLHCHRRCDVSPKPDKPPGRVLLEFARFTPPELPQQEFLTVETEQRHDYTPEFRMLTREFYLRF